MKASSTGLSAGRAGRAGGVSAIGVALRLISRVVAKARTPTRPMTRRVRRIVLRVIQRCSRLLARDIIVAAAERPTCMAAPPGKIAGRLFDVKANLALDRRPGQAYAARVVRRWALIVAGP